MNFDGAIVDVSKGLTVVVLQGMYEDAFKGLICCRRELSRLPARRGGARMKEVTRKKETVRKINRSLRGCARLGK